MAAQPMRIPVAQTPRRLTSSELRDLQRIKPEIIVAKITPELATHWLETKAPNRSIRERRVESLARDIKAGKWQMNGETIKFDKAGMLIDGQHRLWAIIEADREIETAVALGIEREAMMTVDLGTARSLGDQLQLSGKPNARMQAAIGRLWHRYDIGMILEHGLIVTLPELQAALERHPTVEEATSRVHEAIKLGQCSAILWVYSGALEDNREMAQAWLQSVHSGIGLESTSPAYVLRERLMSEKGSYAKIRSLDFCAMALKSWSAWRDGKTLTRQGLSWLRAKGQQFPAFPHTLGKQRKAMR